MEEAVVPLHEEDNASRGAMWKLPRGEKVRQETVLFVWRSRRAFAFAFDSSWATRGGARWDPKNKAFHTRNFVFEAIFRGHSEKG